MAQQAQDIHTVVVGGGQAGLSTSYHLAKRDIPHVVLDASERTGDSWRDRWDSLRVFTQNRFNGLPGMGLPGNGRTRPTKDQVADYLESYATHFDLPVRHSTRVEHVTKQSGRFLVETNSQRYSARNLVVAMSNYQVPYTPAFSNELEEGVNQLHAADYRNPSQVRPGSVLVVGASDSGCEIAMELVENHEVTLAGNHPGHVPFNIDNAFGRFVGVPFVIGLIFHHVLSVKTPMGRRARKKMLGSTGPNVRLKPGDISRAGITRGGRVTGVESGMPVVEGIGRMEVSNVVWCTGFRPDYSWLDIPEINEHAGEKQPPHRLGVVDSVPGLYFVGLFFTRALSSSLLRGVGRDAEYVVRQIER